MKQRREVAGQQWAGAAVLFPEPPPEHLGQLVRHADAVLTLHPGVVHEQQPDPLLRDVHQLEGDVVTRDQVTQPGEYVGVEDVVVGNRRAPFEHVQQVAYVAVSHDPVTGHGATSVLSVRPGYGRRAWLDIRRNAYADRPSPNVEFRLAAARAIVE
jgi:hypothetical protein